MKMVKTKKHLSLLLVLVLVFLTLLSTAGAENQEFEQSPITEGILENISYKHNQDGELFTATLIYGLNKVVIEAVVKTHIIVSDDMQNGKIMAEIISANYPGLKSISFASVAKANSNINNELSVRVSFSDEMSGEIVLAYGNISEATYQDVKMLSSSIKPASLIDVAARDENVGLYDQLVGSEYWYFSILMPRKQPNMETVTNELNQAQSIVTPQSVIIGNAYPCVNYIGESKFKTVNQTYYVLPNATVPVGYFMETAAYLGTNVMSRVIGFKFIHGSVNDDPGNASAIYGRFEIVYDYYILFNSSLDTIEIFMNDSQYKIRNVSAALTTSNSNRDYIYRQVVTTANSGEVGTSSPYVNLALKVVPVLGTYVSYANTVWDVMYQYLRAKGDGSAFREWSNQDSVHQTEMVALTGVSGFNRIISGESKQGFNDNWFDQIGHYISVNGNAKSSAPMGYKTIQFAYKAELCDNNGTGYYVTIKSMLNNFSRTYNR